MPIDANALVGVLIVLVSNKGGISKSTTSQIIGAVAEGKDVATCFVDSDTSNSSMSQVHASTRFVDLSNEENSGKVLEVIEELALGRFGCGIWDTGAREEEAVYAVLEEVRHFAHKQSVPILLVKPITTNPFVQNSAIKSVAFAKRNGFGLLFAIILAQGRHREDLADWYASEQRKSALEYAVEFDVDSMGAVIGDNASSFSMSLTDVAFGRFDRVPEQYRQLAIAKFPRGRQMFMNAYLYKMSEKIVPAISEARHRLSIGKEKKKLEKRQ